jgi:hypothetical protein
MQQEIPGNQRKDCGRYALPIGDGPGKYWRKKMLRVLMLLFLAAFFIGCSCSPGAMPRPPFGEPNDTTKQNSNDFSSVTYLYYCLNNQYVSITYIRAGKCDDWIMSEEFRSEGICLEER